MGFIAPIIVMQLDNRLDNACLFLTDIKYY